MPRRKGAYDPARAKKTINSRHVKPPVGPKRKRAVSPEEVSKRRATQRKRVQAENARAASDIMKFYQRGWASLLPHQQTSKNAIASALVGRGVVSIKGVERVARILAELKKKGRIQLPESRAFKKKK